MLIQTTFVIARRLSPWRSSTFFWIASPLVRNDGCPPLSQKCSGFPLAAESKWSETFPFVEDDGGKWNNPRNRSWTGEHVTGSPIGWAVEKPEALVIT
jgi:hypothetical protein